MSDYIDVEIRIFAPTENGYPVELTIHPNQTFKGDYLLLNIASQLVGVSDEARGQQLFRLLFSDSKTRSAWDRIAGQAPRRHIRLQIAEQAPELHALPWELLHDGLPLAAHDQTPFSRYLPLETPPLPPLTSRPVKMLVVIANPTDLPQELAPIDITQEKANLKKATAETADLELTFLDELFPQTNLSTLSALNQALPQGYHLLHVVAHGAFNPRAKTAALWLADEQNQAVRVIDTELREMLERQTNHLPHVICLASCESASQSADEALRGLAPKVVQAGVPAVVAMQGNVNIQTARLFFQSFYRRLLNHGLVDLAVNQARAELLTAQLPGSGLPVLFSRLVGGRVFEEPRSTEKAGTSATRDINIANVEGNNYGTITIGDINIG